MALLELEVWHGVYDMHISSSSQVQLVRGAVCEYAPCQLGAVALGHALLAGGLSGGGGGLGRHLHRFRVQGSGFRV
jgi:hypothetical protein